MKGGAADRSGRSQRPHNRAAERLGHRMGNGLLRQHRLQSRLQVMGRDPAPLRGPALVGVVDPAPVANDPRGIQDERLGCHPRAHLVRQALLLVLQDREGEPVLPRVPGDLRAVLLRIGVDAQELDASFAIAAFQGRERFSVSVRDGTIGAQENQYQRLSVPVLR